MLYRRGKQASDWHFCQNCPAWPSEDYQELSIEPPQDRLCAECTSRLVRLACDVVPEPGIA
jgi:hypothetical protein